MQITCVIAARAITSIVGRADYELFFGGALLNFVWRFLGLFAALLLLVDLLFMRILTINFEHRLGHVYMTSAECDSNLSSTFRMAGWLDDQIAGS